MGASVGPALSRALEAKFPGQVKTMGVKYPASIQGAVSGAMNPPDAEGSKDMTAKAKEIMSSCPESKIVLGGYSQGAEQVHGALQKGNLGQDGGKIAVALTYGDPLAGERTKAFGGWGCLPDTRAKVFCNAGDGVCGGAFSISAAHLSYTTNGDIAKGAAFAVQIINEGKLEPVQGQCKYAFSAAGMRGTGGSGGSLKGVPKGKGSKGSGGSAAPPAAEPAAAAPEEAAPGRYIIDG
ncbi:cutinase-domain-containing protein [Venturia nashicola]|uniref:Cutinase n=1 Tax=Venturia nashicola TaxID=86259 RepID=A0A4Z1PAM0_9PEZI|nr:cutinase-domain-containing protein [Venturia nashicola]TLD27628.1 cutinase-domain-containing protein [Venturia nashicola]